MATGIVSTTMRQDAFQVDAPRIDPRNVPYSPRQTRVERPQMRLEDQKKQIRINKTKNKGSKKKIRIKM